MADKHLGHICPCDTTAVVRNAHIGRAAVLDLHRYAGGSGINGILHHFLNCRGGAFHHLAGCNQLVHRLG